MKRILTLLAVTACFAATAQHVPGSTFVNSRYRWLGGMFNQLKLPAYADTSNVPQWAPWLSGDAMLDTSGGNAGTIYVRYGSPRKWHAVSGSGGSGGGISEWIAGFGLLNVDDSTGAVDTTLIASRDRLYQQRDSLLALINLRMKYTDTASALSGYVRVGRFLDSLTAHQTRIQTKVAFTDTAAQTAGYTRVTRFLDSLTAVQTRIQTKQATLVSGTNIKTINGTSVLGSGDLTVTGTAGLSPIAENARTSYQLDITNEDTVTTLGDSYTVEYGVSAGQGWNYIWKERFATAIQNLAASGRGVWYAALGANTNLSPVYNSKMVFMMAGINDIRRSTATATYKKVSSGVRAVIGNNLINVFTAGNSGTLTTSGTWTAADFETYGGKSGTFMGGNGVFNNVSGSYVEYTATGTDFLVGYLSNVTGGFSGGNFNISVDGSVYAHVTADQTDGVSDGTDANTLMPGVAFIRGLTNASHTIRVTNSSANYVYLDYFATVKKPTATNPVFIALLPKLTATGYATAPANGSDAAFAIADDSIKNVIAEFAGWPVRYVPVNEYLSTATDYQADSIHLNVGGYVKMADAWASAVTKKAVTTVSAITSLNGLTGTTQTFPTFGATGTTPNVVSTGTTHTFNFPLMAASSVTSGMLSSTLQTIPGEKHWSAGQQIFGALGSPSNGGALELEYTSATSFLSSLDRSGTTWKAMQFRALTYDFLISNSSMGSVSSTFWKFGNVSNPNTLYVDVTGKVGIATSTPRSAFEMRAGTAKFVGPIGFSGSQIVDSTGADIAFINRSDSIIKRMSVPALIALLNTGVTTMAAVGATPNANGASISTNTLTLQPASATLPGVITAAAQTLGGAKTVQVIFPASTTTAGTAGAKFTSGTLMATAEVGGQEFLTDKFYGTITTGAARKEYTLNDAALTSGRIPYATTNGRLLDENGFQHTGAGKIELGSGGTIQGQLDLSGATSGKISIKGVAAAGTYNFNLPITAGNAGEVLTSQAGGSTAMTWTAISGTANANVGSAFRILQPTAQTMKTVSATAPLAWDSTTANQLNVSIDTAGTARLKYVGLGINNTAGSGYSYLDIASAYGTHGQLRLYGGPDPTSPSGGSIWNNSNGHLSFAEASGDFIRLDNQNDIGTATDANYTIANNTYTDVILAATTTANRTLTFPTAITGTEFAVWNRNTGGFTWQVSGTVVDAAGAAITTLTNATVYKFRCFVAGTWTRSN